MASPEQPNNSSPKGPHDRLSENSLKFRENFLVVLKTMVLDKKFGKEFYGEYINMNLRKGFEDPATGEVKKPQNEKEILEAIEMAMEDPMIPEIAAYEKKVRELHTIEEVLEFAKKEGFEFTEEEMAQAKEDTRDILKDDPEL